MTFLKPDTTEETKGKICDEVCIWCSDNCNCRIDQEELDSHCATCVLNDIAKIELKS